ncbi:hypothetical protein SAMN05421805_11284 [Saccharopolyspora antimicrobica]|uniref:Tetratricopeptide repeat-containing protein n=1 Tax=Saccharopolyspora antimicrobica TaxID=455193 RepID=A0A1I5G3M5_9PSEU|nr:hypothetical protein [Saccharopolyspora antimicrobica]RKT83942.1 hypothetical protein ATL45_2237 [Saccharopolyspora antimicrobica]SFO30574.1 hypothetical protein SAMN05421805_11284 [Saccharopolyspora antimicrobica]
MSQRRYCVDDADQWAGWSYYGAAHRYDVHGTPEAASACARAMDQLEAAGDEARLRELALADGDRCAFVRLIEVMVDGDRIDDLRALARGGDDRAFATLMELLFRTDRVEQLRAEVGEFASARLWLAQLHLRRGEVDAGLAELAAAELDPEHGRSAHSERIAQLLRFGRLAEVRAMAEAGDRVAARRLRQFERELDRSQ